MRQWTFHSHKAEGTIITVQASTEALARERAMEELWGKHTDIDPFHTGTGRGLTLLKVEKVE